MSLYKLKVSCYFEIEVEADDSKDAINSVENDYIRNLIAYEAVGSPESIIVKEIKKIKD